MLLTCDAHCCCCCCCCCCWRVVRHVQPEIDLPANTWARLRFLFSASKGWIVLSIMEENTSTGELALSNACELQLLAKDGKCGSNSHGRRALSSLIPHCVAADPFYWLLLITRQLPPHSLQAST